MKWKDLDAKLAKYSAEKTNRELEAHKSCFALPRVTAKEPTRKTIMFGYDSYAKVYHEFLTMNAGIGNRKAVMAGLNSNPVPCVKMSTAGSMRYMYYLNVWV